ncbi:NAD(P)H-dependent glycerol-3-phosphate dehydrogenase [Ovoidimarina sediminis]|uniref:NAD(P)H-dependent glycerol-3-phosphate dehydrogenase n=1 Tax=Ovoidimarina sediminis TaxID=3079856 RepID=UPI0029123A53|nr:NAD(P)H-dependent glycerol-3-phosphate dehydrogenase [Rhodophyticola sp. MJ-SS7]MDU8942505.1 NAD(P)H-dependent glycerol-3-phosphate dehydrogenase [Rhodophyticola sp. MJ-SS7]
MTVAVIGAGAFGTALAAALARDGGPVVLWGRDAKAMAEVAETRVNAGYLPGVVLPEAVTVTADLAVADAEVVLLAVPAQQTRGFWEAHGPKLSAGTVIACAKGIDLTTGLGPAQTIASAAPERAVGILTGPSFADELGAGLPTALTLAMEDADRAEAVCHALSRTGLRLYHSADVIGAELGGALKNVVALAAGICIGAGFGENARAAVIARGFAEMGRLAEALGGQRETLAGLSGLGDLVLTAMSEKSRNTRTGIAIGRGQEIDASITVEGIATARAVAAAATRRALSLPVMSAVAGIVDGRLTVEAAKDTLLARPLKQE